MARMKADAERPTAVIVGVQLAGVTDAEHASSLEELTRLAETLGLRVVGRISQKRTHLDHGAVVGEGKLLELTKWTKVEAPEGDAEDGEEPARRPRSAETGEEPRAQVVLVDHDLTPSQARNLEKATEAEVLDRTAVILAIFQRHARTREARLQVEIARLRYMAPRMREAQVGKDRQRGGIGGKGAGESAVELDRRRIRDRIAELGQELAAIEHERGTRRQRRARAEQATVALVGYTNAGKSSLFRALTGSEVYVADELFATLDTTVRALAPETKPRVLVSDTVGFIKKLPHDLVASFRSTLDEANDASLLLHVVDAADAAHEQQIGVTRQVLAEIGVSEGETPTLLLFNKIDKVSPAARAQLAVAHPEAIQLSARDPNDVRALRDRIALFFEVDFEDAELFVPYTQQRVVARIHEHARVLAERHDESGTHVKLRAPTALLAQLRKELE